MPYDVYSNLLTAKDRHNHDHADYVVAFCGDKMFMDKSRASVGQEVPREPDLVVAYIGPEATAIDLQMRNR